MSNQVHSSNACTSQTGNDYGPVCNYPASMATKNAAGYTYLASSARPGMPGANHNLNDLRSFHLISISAQHRNRKRARWSAATAAFCTLGGICFIAASSAALAGGAGAAPGSPSAPAAGAVKPITTPLRISYSYKPGDVRRYKVVAFFTGHFPPFAVAGSPPIHLMTVLNYAATVKKVTDKGADVDFNVEEATINLLEKEPGEDGKVNPADIAEFPVPLSQVQKLFNATATLKPNGVIANIQGGDTSSIKIDLGIDLRKLFLVTAPVIFADKSVKTGDEWPFDDGLLGSKPGKTTYTGKLQAIGSTGKSVIATVTQQADSTVDSKLDKEGNSTNDANAVVGSLTGTVTLTGTAQLVGTPETSSNGAGASGHITNGKMAMTVSLKRTLPDPDQAGKQLVTDIDIKARLYVSPGEKAAAAAPKPKPAGTGKKTAKK